jgi:outer membrane lipoprotein SlyB
MMTRMTPALACVGILAVLASACATTTTSSTTWGDPNYAGPQWRDGRVEWIRETVERQQGNPAGGAVVGALIGASVGRAFLGRGGGTLMGAAAGAAIGADSSRGYAERRLYEIGVRFDDGGTQVFVFEGYPPFQQGEPVRQTAQGLTRR